jgi:hypothetical protein
MVEIVIIIGITLILWLVIDYFHLQKLLSFLHLKYTVRECSRCSIKTYDYYGDAKYCQDCGADLKPINESQEPRLESARHGDD